MSGCGKRVLSAIGLCLILIRFRGLPNFITANVESAA